jgi:hypothetical protein
VVPLNGNMSFFSPTYRAAVQNVARSFGESFIVVLPRLVSPRTNWFPCLPVQAKDTGNFLAVDAKQFAANFVTILSACQPIGSNVRGEVSFSMS